MVGFSLQTQPIAACSHGEGTSRMLLDALEVRGCVQNQDRGCQVPNSNNFTKSGTKHD